MSVPDTNTFSLQDVVDEVEASSSDLITCFAEANGTFDPTYEGSKDRLSNFRNYTHIIPWDLTTAVLLDPEVILGSPAFDQNGGTWISDDGLQWFLYNMATNESIPKTLSTAWSNQGAIGTGTLKVQVQTAVNDFQFSPDGLILMQYKTDQSFMKSTFGTPYDFTTQTENVQFKSNANLNCSGWRADGKRCYFVQGFTNLGYFDLTVAWDLSTAQANVFGYVFTASYNFITDIQVSPTEDVFFIAHKGNGSQWKLSEFHFGVAGDITTITDPLINIDIPRKYKFQVKPDSTRIWLTGETSGGGVSASEVWQMG